MAEYTAPTITDRSVTAAAREIHSAYDTASPQEQHDARTTAREALTAAVPHLADQPATTEPGAVDALISEHAAKFQQVYDQRTAGDHTFTGALAIFAYDLVPLLARLSADRDTCTEPLPVQGDPEDMQTCDHPALRGTDRCPLHEPRHQQYLNGLHDEIRHLKQTSADRDTETAALRDAVAEIAELRANWVDDYVRRAQKGWRESPWTSADADRIEQEAIQKWNANHPALIALWRRYREQAAASQNETAALRDRLADAVQLVKNCIGHPDTGLEPHSEQIAALRERVRMLEGRLSSISLITFTPAEKCRDLDHEDVERIEALTNVSAASLGGGQGA